MFMRQIYSKLKPFQLLDLHSFVNMQYWKRENKKTTQQHYRVPLQTANWKFIFIYLYFILHYCVV